MSSVEQIRIFESVDQAIGDPCCTPAGVKVDVATVQGHVKVLGALADNTRLAIVEMLSSHDEPVCVCDITSQFDLGQPTISHHLRVLREAGIVHGDKRGLWVYYSLNHAAIAPLAAHLEKIAGGTRVLEAAGK
ncbi:MAG TPA: metalloregulator ArsR/SmtB family transcription factor [Chloroflexia bacterium]|nr:metalloregulator ArsR/SmtB family transcription factor [Chloroflexia bacterium]